MAKSGGIESDVCKRNLEVFERVVKEIEVRRRSSGMFLPETIPGIIHETMVGVARDNGVDAQVVVDACTTALKIEEQELCESLSDYIYNMSDNYEKKLIKRCKHDDPEAIRSKLHAIKGGDSEIMRY
ncbi:MAG: hypothetical protein LBS90_00365 [Oscillospiraceae bacterium]|jgi:hypothetical protein|nr:hypothetical protein [Oscillospiraceae bacterium]